MTLQRIPERKVRRHIPAAGAHPAAPRPGDRSTVSSKKLYALHRQRVLVRRAQGTVDQASCQFGGRDVEDTAAETHADLQLRQNQKYDESAARLWHTTHRLHAGSIFYTI